MKLFRKLSDMTKTKAHDAVQSTAEKVSAFAAEERGDTNFISIIVILGIALLVAGVFIGFKDQIIGQAQAIITSFVIG
jgi:hypothetical protein